MDQLLIDNGYIKKVIQGNFNLISNDTIIELTEQLKLNIKVLPDMPTYLNLFKSTLNKIEILEGITVYNKGILNIELIDNKIFCYI